MTKIYHAHLWGLREDKYRYLLEHDITTVEWTELTPESPAYLFIPQNIDYKAEYETGWKITEIMLVNSVGLYTARDELAIQWTKDELKEILLDFSSLSPEIARNKYTLGEDSRDWQVAFAQKDIQSSRLDNSKIQPISYRPFDTRFTYYTGRSRGFICMPRPNVMYHVLQKDNLGINVCRQIISESWSHIFASSLIVDNCYVSNKSRERNYLFSLYKYPDKNNEQGNLFVERSPNFSSDFLSAIQKKLGYIPTPEAIFYYIYAIFHSPTYRDRYAEFLKSDFPRVPLTSNDQLFKNLSAKGEMLVDLHLMKSKKLNKLITKMSGHGDNNAVTEVTYKPTEQRVYINRDRYFEGISADVWEFKIGGYQVLDKWLKDRKKAKRTLSFDDVLHYQKVVVALTETMQLMVEIDLLIPGFPIA